MRPSGSPMMMPSPVVSTMLRYRLSLASSASWLCCNSLCLCTRRVTSRMLVSTNLRCSMVTQSRLTDRVMASPPRLDRGTSTSRSTPSSAKRRATSACDAGSEMPSSGLDLPMSSSREKPKSSSNALLTRVIVPDGISVRDMANGDASKTASKLCSLCRRAANSSSRSRARRFISLMSRE